MNEDKQGYSTIKIKVGVNTNGSIFEDLEKVKSCTYCIYFQFYGLHACSGHCTRYNKDITGGYSGKYSEEAKACCSFDIKPELLEKNNLYN